MADPALSRWASVRLPWPRFRRPPCDPGRSGFPSPVLTWALPSPPAHRSRNATADPDHAPNHCGLPTKLVPPLRTRLTQSKAWDRFGTAQCPESLRPPRGLPLAGGCQASSRPALPGRQRYYELMRQSSSLATASVGKPCAAGLCRLLSAPAGMSTFPTLSPQSVWRRLDPYPAVFLRCLARFFPKDCGLAIGTTSLAHTDVLCEATSTEGIFRGCSHSLMFRLHNSPGPQIAPTAGPQSVLGGGAIYTRPNFGSLPAQSTGIATCLIRSTGMAGLAHAG